MFVQKECPMWIFIMYMYIHNGRYTYAQSLYIYVTLQNIQINDSLHKLCEEY